MSVRPASCGMPVFFGKDGGSLTVVFGTKGEDGRALTRPLLAAAAERLWGWTECPELERSSRGKPEFAGADGRWLSLSHSGGYALCALSEDGPVGVDIEVVRPHREGLPRYAMNEAELAGFDGSWEDFARVWTLKESWCKREDTPLFPPREIVTPPSCPHGSYAGEDWRAAVCCHGAVPEEIVWLDLL